MLQMFPALKRRAIFSCFCGTNFSLHTLSEPALVAGMGGPASGGSHCRAFPATVVTGAELELLDQLAKLCRRLDQLLRSLLGIGGSARCTLRRLGYARNIAGDLAAALRGFTDVARHLVGGFVLLFDRGVGVATVIVHLVDYYRALS